MRQVIVSAVPFRVLSEKVGCDAFLFVDPGSSYKSSRNNAQFPVFD